MMEDGEDDKNALRDEKKDKASKIKKLEEFRKRTQASVKVSGSSKSTSHLPTHSRLDPLASSMSTFIGPPKPAECEDAIVGEAIRKRSLSSVPALLPSNVASSASCVNSAKKEEDSFILSKYRRAQGPGADEEHISKSSSTAKPRMRRNMLIGARTKSISTPINPLELESTFKEMESSDSATAGGIDQNAAGAGAAAIEPTDTTATVNRAPIHFI